MELTKKHKFLLLCFSLLPMAAIEMAAMAFYSPTRLDQIKEILEPHPKRFWRGKVNYKGRFFGAPVKHNHFGMRAKAEKGADVLVLGGSPSYGWGIPFDKTYSKLLEANLPGKTVVNGSMVGYSSYQGKELLKEVFDHYSPSVVTISYVINDVDHYRFFGHSPDSDKDAPKDNLSSSVLMKLKTIKLLSSLISKMPEPNRTRVSERDYEDNLLEMIKFIRGKSSKVVLIKFPVNLPDKIDDPEIKTLLPKNCSLTTMTSRELYKCLDGRLSDNDLRKLLAINSSLKAKRYNQVLESIGSREGIPVVDAVRAFSLEKDYLFIDKKLDPIHPNEKGHKIIADILSPVVEELL